MRYKREIEKGGYGAPVERGLVRSVNNGRAVVASLDREGLVTTPIPMMYAASINDAVFFCEFDDGTGLVLAPMEPVER